MVVIRKEEKGNVSPEDIVEWAKGKMAPTSIRARSNS
jgi:hypothetical protein